VFEFIFVIYHLIMSVTMYNNDFVTINVDHERYGFRKVDALIFYPESLLIDPAQKEIQVVIFLPGFDGNPQWYVDFLKMGDIFDSLVGNGDIPCVIGIVVDPSVSMGSCFYVNSDSFGKWEDFIVKALPEWIDTWMEENIPYKKGDLVLFGHSMGGFASIYFGMKYPQIYSKIASISGILSVDMVEDWLKFVKREGVWKNKILWDDTHFFTRLVYYMFLSFGQNGHEIPFAPGTEEIYVFDDLYNNWKRRGYDILINLEYTNNAESIKRLYLGIGRRDIVVPLMYYEKANSFLEKFLPDERYMYEVFEGDHITGVRGAMANGLTFLLGSRN